MSAAPSCDVTHPWSSSMQEPGPVQVFVLFLLSYKMPSCIVNQCANKTGRKGQSKDIMLHKFPNEIEKIIEWLANTGQQFIDLQALAMKIMALRKRGKYALCSGHFTSDSYDYHCKGKTLKANAVPTIFPIVCDGEIMIEEIFNKDRSRGKRKRVFYSSASQGPHTAAAQPEQLNFQEDEVCKPGFRNLSTQTSSSLTNSTFIKLEVNTESGRDALTENLSHSF
ncbi:uncharacterized protein LOC143764892 [Ranitomeya variabilis]|uniref:uncharacterized protein LOC143764892 n=1 Tax=Ranitomeya variabilis TaxID=490064 RepID=UPI0040571F84